LPSKKGMSYVTYPVRERLKQVIAYTTHIKRIKKELRLSDLYAT
jgi:hypothetical protein